MSQPLSHPPTKILVVEDDHHDFDLVRDQLALASSPFCLTRAARLDEAIHLLETEPFDAILLDLNLPDSQGFDTYQTIRAHVRSLPIVVFSQHAESQLANRALERGAQDVLMKAHATTELLEHSLQHAIARQKLQSQLEGSERRLQLLADQLPAMIWTTDSDLRLTSIRGRELSMLQLKPDTVVGKAVDEIFAGVHGARSAAELHRRALQGESTSADLGWKHRWYHAHVEPLRNGAGTVAGTIGVALDITSEQKLKRDVHAAHRVQQHLLPSQPPQVRGLDIAGRCCPAEDCSGDFFDYLLLPERRLAIILADVSGHGFGPAILAAAIRSYLRTAAVLGNQVHEMLALANRLLLSDGELTPFASVVAASIDPEARTMRYASAGHPAFLIRGTGEVLRLESLSVPIGVKKDEVFTLSKRFRLHDGDIVFFSSDGTFEARAPNGEYFGIERAIAVVQENRREDAAVIVDKLQSAAREFAGGTALDDDQTVVVVKVVPPSASLRETWTA